jgi:hypothetical protein
MLAIVAVVLNILNAQNAELLPDLVSAETFRGSMNSAAHFFTRTANLTLPVPHVTFLRISPQPA